MLLDERDAFRRRDDADHADVAGAGAAQQVERGDGAAAGRQHRIDHQHVSCRRGPAAASNSTATRPRSARRAAGRCGRRAPSGSSSSTASSMPSPARSTGTTTTSAPDPAAVGAGPSGVCDRDTSLDGTSRVASAASSRLMRTAIRRNSFRRRRRVAQRRQRIVHERMLNDMNRHDTLYNPPSRFALRRASRDDTIREPAIARTQRIQFALHAASNRFRVLAAVIAAGQAAPRQVSLIVTNGTVVTMDAGRRVLTSAAVADRRPRHRRGRHRRQRSPRAIDGRRRSTPRGAGRHAGPRSTPTPTRRWCCTAAWPTTSR